MESEIKELFLLLKSEINAVNEYEAAIKKIKSEKVIKRLEEIRDDEKEHIREISSLILNSDN